MATKKQEQYGNTSISMLKGEDRVRKRPAVIFGSDDLEGCKHAVFEILSNAIDEAREGHGDTIIVTRYEDLSVEVEDFGRGCPVDYNEKEKRYNWELVFCEMYAVVSTAKTVKTTNIPWALTVWAPALPSMHRNSLMRPSAGTDSVMICILKKVVTRAA